MSNADAALLGTTVSDREHVHRDHKVYLVGGGIASLAAAAFMIRDGDVLGRNITISEDSNTIGGSLDRAGSARRWSESQAGRTSRPALRPSCDPTWV